jgi:hypothetical protein
MLHHHPVTVTRGRGSCTPIPSHAAGIGGWWMQGRMTPIKMSPGCSLGRSGGRTLGVALGVARTTSGSLMDVVRSAMSVRPFCTLQVKWLPLGWCPAGTLRTAFHWKRKAKGFCHFENLPTYWYEKTFTAHIRPTPRVTAPQRVSKSTPPRAPRRAVYWTRVSRSWRLWAK